MTTYFFYFFFNDTPTTEIYTLSLHDALPICADSDHRHIKAHVLIWFGHLDHGECAAQQWFFRGRIGRSEEHTSELQSLRHLVCRLLLEKKKKKENTSHISSLNK